MAPKPKQRGAEGEAGGKSGQGRGGSGRRKESTPKPKAPVMEERHDPFQAVVLTDVFETRFEPFTLEKPRCLLPIANTLMIDYTLEFLSNAGVEDVLLYAGAHADQIETYINGSKWKSIISPFTKVRFLRSTASTIGEAMRDLHGKHLMNTDFVLVNGDVISNIPLDDALTQHRARRKANRNAIMTMVLKEVGINHRTRDSSARPLYIMDPTDDRCLHYEELQPTAQLTSDSYPYPAIEPDLIESHAEIDVRNDLYDCRIDICTPEVLGLWADSFDYQAPRTHFLHGVLKDYELNGVTIHAHILKENYATRVQNLHAYNVVSQDVISRWTFPLVPDTNLFPGYAYSFNRRFVYHEQGAVMAKSADIRCRTVIGKGTTIGENAVISNSVIGRRCQIGENVVLDGAYIWDDVVVGDASEIKHAIVANRATIGKKCRIEPGALLSYGVKIANEVSIPENMRITKMQQKTGKPVPNDAKIVGEGGEGFEFIPVKDEADEDEEDEEDFAPGLMYKMAELSLSDASISTMSSDMSEDEAGFRSRSGSIGTSASEDEDTEHFHHDAVSSVLDGLEENLSADVVQLELVGLRMSANASEHGVRRAVVTAFMKFIQRSTEAGNGIAEAVKKLLTKYKDIVDRIVFDHDDDDKSDQVDLLLLFQKDLTTRPKGETTLLFTVKELYDLEIVDEDAFTQWWEDEQSTSTEEMSKVRAQTQPFMDWLESADSDSDDESDDDSD